MPARTRQVTSLHYHFPWLIKANVRWSLFCAATKRRMRPNLDWAPFFEIAGKDLPYRERLRAYARIAHERFETDRFQEFCDKHLGHLDEVAYEFFGSTLARDAVHQKVSALFPPHEIEEFTELFWGRIQTWRESGGRAPVKEVSRWWSPRLEREVTVARWGHWGAPVLLFPTAGGDARRDRAHAGDRRASAADRGRPDQGLFLRQRRRAGLDLEAALLELLLAPAEPLRRLRRRRRWCRRSAPIAAPSDIEIVAAGASIGAFNAVASLCRHPDVFRPRSALSGTYDLEKLFGFRADDELLLLLALAVRRQPAATGGSSSCCGGASCFSPSARAAGRTRRNPGAWPTCSAARASPTASTPGATSRITTGRPGGRCCLTISVS